MPGWRVQTEAQAGMPTPQQPVRADLTLVGIPVPAGAYTFDLIYQPDSIRLGLWISGAAVLLLAAATAGRWPWKRRVAA